jgi:DNA-binding MarR family transcriptional regulator
MPGNPVALCANQVRSGGLGRLLYAADVAASRGNGRRAGTGARDAADASPSLGSAMVAMCRLTEIALHEAEVSLTEYRILNHLHLGHTIQSDLAFHLAVSKQSVTRLVDPLVDRGYITRLVDPDDRRRVIHTITAKGERVLARTDAVLEKYLLFVLQDLEDDRDVDSARVGLALFARGAVDSYKRVHPDGIEPGRLHAQLRPGAARGTVRSTG